MDTCTIFRFTEAGDPKNVHHRSPTKGFAMQNTLTAAQATQVCLPGTDHVLAELGSIYPTVAYWAAADAGDEESFTPAEQADELDEVIFAGVVSQR